MNNSPIIIRQNWALQLNQELSHLVVDDIKAFSRQMRRLKSYLDELPQGKAAIL